MKGSSSFATQFVKSVSPPRSNKGRNKGIGINALESFIPTSPHNFQKDSYN